MVLEKTLESPLDWKEIQPVHPKGNQSWIFIGRTDAEAETPILWPDLKSRLIGKDPHAGKGWRQEEKGTTEDEMVGWHHHLNGHEFEQGPGVGDGQGSLTCFGTWGCKDSDTTEWLNWTELMCVCVCVCVSESLCVQKLIQYCKTYFKKVSFKNCNCPENCFFSFSSISFLSLSLIISLPSFLYMSVL